ncbi:hypothetical protein [Caballeronia calidae]|uniref:hypothetical protein n=1 Tax=Caballeronia calidae TaxID=1777139 RepID=UPI001E575CA4|nr:hypothetical protein [Caballeronia calidae]
MRRWIGKYKAKRRGVSGTVLNVSESGPPVFVPVVQARGDTDVQTELGQAVKPEPLIAPVRREPVRASQRPLLPSRLVAQSPNGVSVELECAAQDAVLVTAMIETLGRCHVSGSTLICGSICIARRSASGSA